MINKLIYGQGWNAYVAINIMVRKENKTLELLGIWSERHSSMVTDPLSSLLSSWHTPTLILDITKTRKQLQAPRDAHLTAYYLKLHASSWKFGSSTSTREGVCAKQRNDVYENSFVCASLRS
jgi:hypothetical protein